MIYCIIYSPNKDEVENLEGEFLEWNVPAKDLEEVKDLAKRRLVQYGFNYCTIFTFNSDGVVILAVESIEDVIFESVGRWFM
ncbi:hypothetical protein E3E22_10500 [Thermococcus sp. MV5]|nr:hypothetical protein [Thermococcus sp. MV5]NJE27030.1 hypothetical protein [Thermococcus sp. MV5]